MSTASRGRARARVVVTGRVQGVMFRQATVDEAQRIGGLSGWIRNRADGSVELLAEGERAAVEALVAFCRRGPRLARVDDLQVAWEPTQGNLAPFDIGF
ncbi:MAG TPA: acylphosphatase [Anaeromyxobacteraceae bacterium]|nr:acylphosphatase [Anaeromyxobacteraceae bacterium]